MPESKPTLWFTERTVSRLFGRSLAFYLAVAEFETWKFQVGTGCSSRMPAESGVLRGFPREKGEFKIQNDVITMTVLRYILLHERKICDLLKRVTLHSGYYPVSMRVAV